MVKAAIVGGSGYTGGELARLLCRHPSISLETVTSRQLAGTKISSVHANLEGFLDLKFEERLVNPSKYDVVFVAAPHGASMGVVPELLAAGTRVVDLSGDYRLRDSVEYKKWYGLEHKDEANLGRAAYGITELFGDAVKKADLV
ncbi:MAG TPA: N-acetyl-gamma-glutamyl-phosphate reductase, partial [Methanomassiliicoccales archaeon]|nr:N-acetyl-gamma-glutamyl-phosphate reductase [Methanomassiliicoccales archaeon]